MVIVGTDGYILNVIGPYFADSLNNDVSITKHFLRHSHPARSWFKENDVVVVDRGFRNAIDFLENQDFMLKCHAIYQKVQNNTVQRNPTCHA